MSNVDTYDSYGPIIADAVPFYPTIFSSDRMIGGIFPDVVVEEFHRDDLMITLQPVEASAPITDHSFMMPYSVEIRGGFSNSSAGSEGWVQAAYRELLALQASRQPFDVSTGKRYYSNMLFRSLSVTTNDAFEYALNFTAICQQVILVSVQTTGGSGTPAANSNGTTATDTSPSEMTAQNAQAAGLSVDSNGNVGWPNYPSLSTGAQAGIPYLNPPSLNWGGAGSK